MSVERGAKASRSRDTCANVKKQNPPVPESVREQDFPLQGDTKGLEKVEQCFAYECAIKSIFYKVTDDLIYIIRVILIQPDYFVSCVSLKIVTTGTTNNQEKRQWWLLTKSFAAGLLNNSNKAQIRIPYEIITTLGFVVLYPAAYCRVSGASEILERIGP